MRVFSGIQPSGNPTFGNYSGGFRQYVATQDRALSSGGAAIFCLVELHAITVEYEPVDLRTRTLDLAALLYATRLDHARSAVFAQSGIRAHAERSWLLGAGTSYGQHRGMTQFKEKG